MHNAAIIFGCTGDIGKHFALQSVHSYSHLVLIGRDTSKLSEIKHQLINSNYKISISTVVCDLSDSQSIALIIDWLSFSLPANLDFFYMAGQALSIMPISFMELSSSELLNIFNVNLYSPLTLLSCLLFNSKYFKHSRVFILGSSLTRSIPKGEAFAHAYASSKMALHGYVTSARDCLAEHGIHVTLVQPGYIQTKMTEGRGLIRKFGGSISVESFSSMFSSISRIDQSLPGDNIINPTVLH